MHYKVTEVTVFDVAVTEVGLCACPMAMMVCRSHAVRTIRILTSHCFQSDGAHPFRSPITLSSRCHNSKLADCKSIAAANARLQLQMILLAAKCTFATVNVHFAGTT